MGDDASSDGPDSRDGRDDGPDVQPARTPDATGSGWGGDDRIPIDLSGSDTEQESTDTGESDEYAPEPSSSPIEPGDPDLEHAAFILLGAIAMVLVIVRVLALPLG